MQKLGFTGMKNLDQLKSLAGYTSGTAKTLSTTSRSSSDSITLGSFANLKLTAEKLIKEQASLRTDLDTANAKLKKSLEHIQMLEEKLQAAFNENAKLKVKQKEDEKLRQGLESKVSSTKTLCDQLIETVQVLACQVEDAEKDKQSIAEKFMAHSAAVDNMNGQMKDLSLNLDLAEGTIKERDQKLEELKVQKEEQTAFYADEQSKAAKLVEKKDALIKSLEADVMTNRLTGENLQSKLEDANMQLKLKDEDFLRMKISLENLERDKIDLQSSNEEFSIKLAMTLQETQNLKDIVNAFASELIEMDKQSTAVSENIAQLCSMYDSFSNLVVHEKDLAAKHAKWKYGHLHNQQMQLKSEKDELQSVHQELIHKFNELQRAQESTMVEHAEECRVTEEKIRKLESEVEALVSRKIEAEKIGVDLEGRVSNLSESLKSIENEKKELLLKWSESESGQNENLKNLQENLQKKEDEIDAFQKEILNFNSQVQSLEKQINTLEAIVEEKEQLVVQFKEREKQLEDKKAEVEALLATAEVKLGEAKKQYDAMLDSKQSELSRHLKEISQRNDQAINDIRKKYEIEKQEIVNLEKQKADKIIAEKEQIYEQRIDQCKKESRQRLVDVQEGHTSVIDRIQKEHERNMSNLRSEHLEEVKRIQLQAEKELGEKTMTLRNDHEAQIKALRLQHEEDCRQLQQELDLQRSKEERQRALLQMQWRVMGDKPQEEQEVNSKKEYSISSVKRNDPDAVKKSMPTQDTPYQAAVTSPASNLLKKADKTNSGNIVDISKHGRKVTHREYEVETSHGVTKRRKTKSTVMFGDPRKHKKTATPKVNNTPQSSIKANRTKVYTQTQPSNIGDLFSEGSLNPYADGDDPYAFD